MAHSSAEVDHRAMENKVCELTWLKAFLQEIGMSVLDSIPLYCDNQAAIYITNNSVFHERTKHIEVDCYSIHSKVESKEIITLFVSSKSQLVDTFTKPLNSISEILGIVNIHSPT